MSQDVRLEFRKYDGSPHWSQTLRRLGEDEHGLWLGSPAGGTWRRANGRVYTNKQAQVLNCNADRWWTATFNDAPATTAIYVDVSTPAVIEDGLVTSVDLDLDVRLFRSGGVKVEDEDEFADHQVRYGYPADVIANARATADWLAANITVVEPFVSVHRQYLDRIA
jgi:protein associated with RNAse G/E